MQIKNATCGLFDILGTYDPTREGLPAIWHHCAGRITTADARATAKLRAGSDRDPYRRSEILGRASRLQLAAELEAHPVKRGRAALGCGRQCQPCQPELLYQARILGDLTGGQGPLRSRGRHSAHLGCPALIHLRGQTEDERERKHRRSRAPARSSCRLIVRRTSSDPSNLVVGGLTSTAIGVAALSEAAGCPARSIS